MTNQHPANQTTQPTASTDAVVRACVHIDAAARQLEAAADGDAFSPLLDLAGQLSLLRGGIDPTIRAAVDPNDHLGPIGHVHQAHSLLNKVPASAGPPDLPIWTLRLDELLESLLAAAREQR